MPAAAAETKVTRPTLHDIIDPEKMYTAEAVEYAIGIPADQIRREFFYDAWPNGARFCSVTWSSSKDGARATETEYSGRELLAWVEAKQIPYSVQDEPAANWRSTQDRDHD